LRPPRDLSAGMGESGRASVGLAALCPPTPFASVFTPRSWESEGNLGMLPSVLGSRCRLPLRNGAAAAAESFGRLGFPLSLPSIPESQGSKPPKPQSASESQPSPASSLGSASSNGRSALNGPKSDLDEGGEDDRVRVPSSIRSSSAGVRRSERTSLGFTVLCPPSSAAPSLSDRTWGSEGDPRVLPGALSSLLRVLLRSGAASEVELLHLRGFALPSPEAPTLALRA
jgi:hypothetical protein